LGLYKKGHKLITKLANSSKITKAEVRNVVAKSYYYDLVRMIGRAKNPKTHARMIHILNRMSKQPRTHVLLRCCGNMGYQQAQSQKARVYPWNSEFSHDTLDTSQGDIIRQVLHECALEMITDEQLERVLAPIRRMIAAGVFDRKA